MTITQPRPRLITRTLLLVFVANVGALTSFYLMISAVPLYAASVGATGTAGATTAALLLTSVVAGSATPGLMSRFGSRPVLAAGLLLLGLPALLMLGAGLAMMLVSCVLRGVGFAIVMVATGAMVPAAVPAARRGEALGLYGVACAFPGVVGLPLGVWLATHAGFAVVFAAGAVTGLAGLVTVPGLPGASAERATGMGSALRCGALLRPAFVFTAITAAAGVVVGFLPLAAGGVASSALLAQSVSATVARWLAGRYGDRHGPAALLIPAVLLAAAGMLALVLIGSPVAVLAGMVLFGAGFGAAQSSTLNLMLNRVGPAGYGPVSAMWNVAYDGGMGLGAAGFGLLVTHTGYTAAFALTAALIATAVLPARLDRRARAAG